MLIPDSSIKGSLKTPSLISPEKITFLQREGSKPSLTLTLFQSSQLQPFFVKAFTSWIARFRYILVRTMVLPGIFDPFSYPVLREDLICLPQGGIGKGVNMRK
jgi:hypothetical protein